MPPTPQDIFLSVVGLLAKLIATDEGALAVAEAAAPGCLKQWEGVAAIIGRKMDMERKYIARLEGEAPRMLGRGGGVGWGCGWRQRAKGPCCLKRSRRPRNPAVLPLLPQQARRAATRPHARRRARWWQARSSWRRWLL
jgi:hypothetical protein